MDQIKYNINNIQELSDDKMKNMDGGRHVAVVDAMAG